MHMYSATAIYLYIVCVQHPAYPLQYLQALLTAEDRADQFKSMASPYTSVCGQFPVAVGLGITASNFQGMPASRSASVKVCLGQL